MRLWQLAEHQRECLSTLELRWEQDDLHPQLQERLRLVWKLGKLSQEQKLDK